MELLSQDLSLFEYYYFLYSVFGQKHQEEENINSITKTK